MRAHFRKRRNYKRKITGVECGKSNKETESGYTPLPAKASKICLGLAEWPRTRRCLFLLAKSLCQTSALYVIWASLAKVVVEGEEATPSVERGFVVYAVRD